LGLDQDEPSYELPVGDAKTNIVTLLDFNRLSAASGKILTGLALHEMLVIVGIEKTEDYHISYQLNAGVSGPGPSSTYELIRHFVGKVNSPFRFSIRCLIQPGQIVQSAEVGGLGGEQEQTVPFTANDAKIQEMVKKASGISAPDPKGADGVVNWWVRANSREKFKLIKSTLFHSEDNKQFEDPSDAGKTLAIFMGINCLRTFGQPN
jgi:hypothetical protein